MALDSDSSPEKPTFFFLTDYPPLTGIAVAYHGVGAQFIHILRERCRLLITHRYRRAIDPAKIAHDFAPTEFLFYPSAGGLGLRRYSSELAEILDLFLCLLALPEVRDRARTLQPDRLFVQMAGSAWYYLIAWLTHRATGLPMDIYLGDDLEECARLTGRPLLARITRPLERWVLRQASRVFVVSPGYVHHLHALYGVRASYLSIPFDVGEMAPRPFTVAAPDVRVILFVGSDNDLYRDSLVDLYQAIDRWNNGAPPFQLLLRTVSTLPPTGLIKLLPHERYLDVRVRVPNEELDRELHECWATFLPYSFEPLMRTMVSTSFSCKLKDSLRSGRPILVYGPDYASMTRYFLDHGLPLVATSPDQLMATIAEIDRVDTPELIERYRAVWEKNHSAAAILDRLAV